TYILLASHVAAMHPTSNLGAATPVDIGGSGVTDDDAPGRPGSDGADEVADAVRDAVEASDDATDEDTAAEDAAAEDSPAEPERNPSAMGRKIINDAVSYIRTLAERHDRNADWAEKAVRDGATLTAREAVEQNVADVLASNLEELLTVVDGTDVVLDGGDTATLATAGADISFLEPTWRQKLLLVISDPSIAVLLVLVGVYGLWFEAFNPGAIVPGVIGAICLLLAAYALQVMPVNYVGLGLILLGVLLMVAEVFVPSFGALGLGGIIAFVVGAIMAFDTGVPGFEISRFSVGGIAAVVGGLTFATAAYARRLHTKGAVTGVVGMKKHQAVAIDDFDGEGFVWLESERWHAVSDGPVRAGETLQVT
ncbi:MAG: nodulation protein NfeD, partial [Planctomycetota bacterium]